jgi:protein-L-isoaspartate(D-aspartate) O-methyltransferase
LEEDAELARMASAALNTVGAKNVAVVQGALADGWPGRAPYDVILLDGRSEIVPHQLFQQLKDGGRLVGVFGEGAVAKATVYLSERGDVSGRPIFDAMAALLPGFARAPAFVF